MAEQTERTLMAASRQLLPSRRQTTFTLDSEKVAWIALLLLAAVSRFYALGDRVISHDESLHAYYSWELSQGRGFQHTPLMHGPFQFHVVALSFFLLGDSDVTTRVPAALFGIAAVGLLWCFREWLGRIGAFAAGVMLTISPFLLYYSRYVRNEAFAVVWALLMVLAIRRYLLDRRTNWLYLLAGVTALSHATKEVAFLYDAILMFYLGLLFVRANLQATWERPVLRRVFAIFLLAAAVAVALAFVLAVYGAREAAVLGEGAADESVARLSGTLLAAGAGLVLLLAAAGTVLIARRSRLHELASFDLLLLMGTLVLPQLVALPVRMIINADPLDYSAAGMWHTGPVLAGLLLASVAIGLAWDWRKWLLCAGIFYAIYLFFFTTMFSNGGGLATGMVGSLGYWLEQQGVERGSQPWYYYALVQVPMYEYLPATGALVAAWWAAAYAKTDLRTGERPAVAAPGALGAIPFLGFWLVTTFVIYAVAGEKMPWLTVHIALPMIMVAGWLVGRWAERVDWGIFRDRRGVTTAILVLLGLMAMLDVFWRFGGVDAPLRGTTLAELQASMGFLSALVVLLGAAAGVFASARRMGWRNLSHVVSVVALGILALLTIRTSIAANYVRFDEQTEFINYASGAPGIRVVMEQVEEISRRATDGLGIRVAYDDDVSWPFTWYLRNYPNQVFFGGEPSRDSFRDTPLVVAGDNNWPKVEAMLGDKYHSFEYIRMWWPMQDYFHLTIDRVRSNLVDPARRAALWDIWFRRDYTRYGEVHGGDFSLSNWPVVDRMRFYIEKDLATQLWNLGIEPAVLSEPAEPDPYEALTRMRTAALVWGAPGTGAGEFDRPRDVAVGPDGFVYVTDTFNHRIQKFDRDGRFVLEWGGFGMVEGGDAALGRLNEPWGLTVSDDGFVYVADTWNHRVQKFTLTGQPVAVWGRFGDDMDLQNMWGPREVTIGPQGLVYVSDTGNKRVTVFSPEGEGVRQIGSGGALDGQIDEPVGLAVSDEGSVFVADTWNGRVQVFDGAGDSLRHWGVPGWHGQSLDNKPYLAMDDEGRVYASDPEVYRILVWDAVGNPLGLWGGYGSDAASFDLPTGVALDAKGGLYVTDAGNNRVMYFAPE